MKRVVPAAIIAALIMFVSHVAAAEPGMYGLLHASVTKSAVGSGNGETFYQWYVSIYQDGTKNRLLYQSPRDGGPLDKVEKAKGANLWFPRQEASIIGTAPLMGDGLGEVVVQSHQAGADCGSADLTIFRYDPKSGKIVPAVTVQNGCELNAKIVKNSDGAYLQLSGPYYNATAPMCCPTKPKATATLKYANGKWIETPNYYKFYPNAFPHV